MWCMVEGNLGTRILTFYTIPSFCKSGIGDGNCGYGVTHARLAYISGCPVLSGMMPRMLALSFVRIKGRHAINAG